MQDENPSTPRPAFRRRRSGQTIALASLLAFLLGAALVGWLAWHGELASVLPSKDTEKETSTRLAAAAPSPGPAASPAAAMGAIGAMETRLALLEERLSRVDVEADAASGNAARAEALLIAYAARRMIEKGAPLGYVEDQLKLRFADAQPNAVRIIIESARAPVTLDELCGRLDALAPSLANAPAKEGAWTRVKRELSGLFVIRHESTPSPDPESRIARARLLLTTGKINAAIAEVEHLPGAEDARDWIADARRYDATQRALDLIETTAMLEPRRLQDARGQTVTQPSPLAAPAGRSVSRP